MPDDIKLPELPEPDATYGHDFWMAESMMSYARAAVEAERARRVPTAPDNSEYKRGWDECMAVWADHMRRMNAALNTPLPPGWANHASHILQNVREALDAAHGIPAPKGGSDAQT